MTAPERCAGTPPGAVEAAELRRTMGRFATGVAVVTTGTADEPHGMTVNSLTSVSLDPPLLLVCLTTGARTTEAVVTHGMFTVNVLATRQHAIARRFASRGADHFAGLPVEFGRHRVPVVPAAMTHLECDVEAVHPGGDHVIVLGRVRSLCAREGDPLLFFGGGFGAFDHHREVS